jgi:hypothetical protein
VHLKSELIKGVASFERDNLVIFYFSVHLKSCLIREVACGVSGLIKGKLQYLNILDLQMDANNMLQFLPSIG